MQGDARSMKEDGRRLHLIQTHKSISNNWASVTTAITHLALEVRRDVIWVKIANDKRGPVQWVFRVFRLPYIDAFIMQLLRRKFCNEAPT